MHVQRITLFSGNLQTAHYKLMIRSVGCTGYRREIAVNTCLFGESRVEVAVRSGSGCMLRRADRVNWLLRYS